MDNAPELKHTTVKVVCFDQLIYQADLIAGVLSGPFAFKHQVIGGKGIASATTVASDMDMTVLDIAVQSQH